jgi:hypothetical protein
VGQQGSAHSFVALGRCVVQWGQAGVVNSLGICGPFEEQLHDLQLPHGGRHVEGGPAALSSRIDEAARFEQENCNLVLTFPGRIVEWCHRKVVSDVDVRALLDLHPC